MDMNGKWKRINTAPKDGTSILAVGMAVPGFPVMVWDDSEPRVVSYCVIHWAEGWYDRHEEVSPDLYKKVPAIGYSHWSPNPQQFKPLYWISLTELPTLPNDIQ